MRINASPGGGILRVNGVVDDEFSRGLSRLPLAAGKKHTLRYQKPGYIPQSRDVLLKPDEQAEISFQLEKEIGEVVIRSTPPAEIVVGGRPAGTTPQTLHLQALRQKITLRRPQYRTMELFVTPTAAAPLLIDEKPPNRICGAIIRGNAIFERRRRCQNEIFRPPGSSEKSFHHGRADQR